MKKNSLLLSSLSAAAVVAGSGFLVFDEVMNRDAKIYDMLLEIINKKQNYDSGESYCTDERFIWFYNCKMTEYEMVNSKNYRLKAYLIPSEKESNVYVFCSHGYKCNGKHEYELMAKFYHDLGYNVFMIDHQAHGESDGKYIGFGYHESKDAMLWINWMINKFGKDIQIILQGVSMGCATVTMMAGCPTLPDNVKFVVADCGYTSAEAEFEYILKSQAHLPTFPIVNVADKFNQIINGYAFKDANPLEAVKAAQVPILFVHGSSDTFVPTYMVHELYNSYNGKYKDLLLVDGAGHAESYKKNSEAYENKVKEFADKFLIEEK